MRHSRIHAIALTLSRCGSAAAQQGLLVRQDDSSDPCRRFKMRVLVPADLNGFKPFVKRPVEAVDYKMNVWNPCRQDEPQIALLTPSVPIQGMSANNFTSQSLKLRFPFLENKQKESFDLSQTRPPLFLDLGRRK